MTGCAAHPVARLVPHAVAGATGLVAPTPVPLFVCMHAYACRAAVWPCAGPAAKQSMRGRVTASTPGGLPGGYPRGYRNSHVACALFPACLSLYARIAIGRFRQPHQSVNAGRRQQVGIEQF